MIIIKKIITRISRFLTAFFFSITSIIAMPSDPVLIDYNLVGSGQTPYFEPRSLDLLVGQPYLFVINNPFPNAVNVIFGKFGQSIHTHYLQGVPGMSQSSIMIPADGKVTWILDIKKPGQYEIFAVNMGMGQKGQSSHINVQPAGGNAQYTAEELKEFEKLNKQLQPAQNAQSTSQSSPQKEQPEKVAVKSPHKKQPRLMGGRPG